MNKRIRNGLIALGAAAVVAIVVPLAGRTTTHRTTRENPGGRLSTDQLLHFVRERFGVPDRIKLSAGPLHDSAAPQFYETTVTVEDGNPKDTKTQPLYVTKDGRYVLVGGMVAVSGSSPAAIENAIRNFYKIPAKTGLTVGPPERSKIPFLNQVKVRAGSGGAQNFYLTQNGRELMMGTLYRFSNDPRRDILRAISLANQPSVGPAHAPVTIVEYADLQCPSCARVHQFLEHQVLPKYGDKVRVIFKEFPLPIHRWSMMEAIANECAYEINPADYLPYRTLLFQHQGDVEAQTDESRVREMLLGWGQEAGVNRVRLASCIDSKGSLARVEQGMNEGTKLSINQTPTMYINGRPLIGLASAEDFFSAIDAALQDAH